MISFFVIHLGLKAATFLQRSLCLSHETNLRAAVKVTVKPMAASWKQDPSAPLPVFLFYLSIIPFFLIPPYHSHLVYFFFFRFHLCAEFFNVFSRAPPWFTVLSLQCHLLAPSSIPLLYDFFQTLAPCGYSPL